MDFRVMILRGENWEVFQVYPNYEMCAECIRLMGKGYTMRIEKRIRLGDNVVRWVAMN